MKKIPAMLLAVLMVVSLFAGCTSGNGAGAAEPPAAEATNAPGDEAEAPADEAAIITKVALVTDVGTIDDESFNQACWLGVEAWCSANGVDYTYYQPTEDSNDARILSVAQAIAEGADTIVLPGYLFGAALTAVMEVYPEIHFIAVDVSADDLTMDDGTSREPTANVACLTFSEEQAGYLAGYAAVREGYTRLGFLGGTAVPGVIRYGYGFIQGADAAASEMGVSIQINYTYGGQFEGSPEITAKMEGWYQGGTEVVFACGGGIYTSALEAAQNNGGKVIGVDVDQSYIAPEYFVTSAMKRLQNVTETILEALHNGEWARYAGKVSNFSMAEGEYIGLPTDTWTLENISIDEYEAVKAQIADGTIVVDRNTEAMPETSDMTTVNEIG